MFDTSDFEDEQFVRPEMLPLASPDLDTDETTARRAGDLLLRAHRHVLDNFCELERMAYALQQSESASNRAMEASTKIRHALVAMESGLIATSAARDAMVFDWT